MSTTPRPLNVRSRCAARLCADHPRQGERAGVASVLAAAEFFGAVSDRSGFMSDQEAAGEHATPRQRMFNVRCWADGATPSRLEWLVGDGLLPESRASRYPTEVTSLTGAWSLLLRDSVR